MEWSKLYPNALPLDDLEVAFTFKEIWEAIKEIPGDKSSIPDNFVPFSFKDIDVI